MRLHVILYQPEIPQNTGNIGRTCVAIDAKLWIVRPTGFQLDDRQLSRAGLDYWQHLDLEIVANWPELRERLPTSRLWYFTRHATKKFTEVNYADGDALVFGSESRGLPQSILAGQKEAQLRIPMTSQVRSLNLATAVGIACYEATRQSPPGGDPSSGS
jgi:tRNA (cytidine/uridine-2'-O-)-methyltransferase